MSAPLGIRTKIVYLVAGCRADQDGRAGWQTRDPGLAAARAFACYDCSPVPSP
jgi:hypothetical protein